MNPDNLKIYQKIHGLRDYLFPVLDHFPKREKFALCTRIKQTIYDLAEAVIRVALTSNKAQLCEADVKLQMFHH